MELGWFGYHEVRYRVHYGAIDMSLSVFGGMCSPRDEEGGFSNPTRSSLKSDNKPVCNQSAGQRHLDSFSLQLSVCGLFSHFTNIEAAPQLSETGIIQNSDRPGLKVHFQIRSTWTLVSAQRVKFDRHVFVLHISFPPLRRVAESTN